MEHIHLKNEPPDAIKSFASGIAHDLNNLLTAIKARATLMKNSVNQSDPLYGHIVQTISCIDQGSEISNQLLGFAKADEFYASPFDVNRLVRKIVENLDLQGEKVVLDVDLESNPLVIEADSEKINQVLMTIIDNALLAMSGRGKLSVVTESASILNGSAEAFGINAGFFVKITIADTGIGMDQDMLNKIFLPFYSADHEHYPDKKGLGLTFAREIVHNHNGVIDVWSSPKKGSSFSVILPLKEMPDDMDTQTENQNLVMGNESLLLVDNEEPILTVVGEICETLGYKVFTAASGKDAINTYKEKKSRINLVVLDMVMPEMNGYETFLELKKLNPDIKVLISTGYTIDKNAQDALKQGCKGYILKPYDITSFSHKLREVL